MEWVKQYTTFHDHRKTVELDANAIALWTLCLSWSGAQDTAASSLAALPSASSPRGAPPCARPRADPGRAAVESHGDDALAAAVAEGERGEGAALRRLVDGCRGRKTRRAARCTQRVCGIGP